MSQGVTVDFNANLARFTSAVDRATNDLNRFQSNTSRISSNLNRILGTFGVGLSVAGILAFTKRIIDLQDHFKDLSLTTRLSVETIAGLASAAKKSGGDIDGIAASIAKLSVEMGKNSEKFRALGITAKDPLEAFGQLADILNGIEDQTTRAAVAAVALGKGWQSAAPLLAEGSEKIEAMVKQGTRLSKITTESADRADEFKEKLTDLGTIGMGGVISLFDPLLKSILEINRALKDGASLGEIWNRAVAGITPNKRDTGILPISGLSPTAAPPISHPTSADLKKFIGGAGEEAKAGKAFEDFETRMRSAVGGAINDSDVVKAGELVKQIEILDDLFFKSGLDAGVYSSAMDKLTGATQKYNDELEEGKDLYEQTRTPLERLDAQYARINELLRQGAIDQDTYRRAVIQAQAEFENSTIKQISAVDDFARKASENIQDSLADFLFDPFDDGIKGMLDSFSSMVRRMVAEAAAADLAKRLLGGAGGIEDLVKFGINVIGGVFGFGQTQAPAPVRDALPAIPKFASGIDYVPRDMLAFIHQGERVVPAAENARGGGITINFAISGAVDSRTQMQIAQQAGAAVQRAMRRNG